MQALNLDAASFRSLTCLPYHPGLAWIRSYWDAPIETLFCVYRADDPEQIRHHAQRAALPCDEIREVDEVLPTDFTGGSVALEANAVVSSADH